MMQDPNSSNEDGFNVKLRRFYESKNYNRYLVAILTINYFFRVLCYFSKADHNIYPEWVHWLFTASFALDVILNIATHTAREYWTDPWSVLMFIVVFLTTLFDLLLKFMPFGQLQRIIEASNRVLKLFRVIEFFKRVTLLNEIASNLVRLWKILFTAVFTILFLAFTYAAIMWEAFGISRVSGMPEQWKLGSYYEIVAVMRTLDAQTLVDQYQACKEIDSCNPGLLAFGFVVYYVIITLFMIEILSSIFVNGYIESAEEAKNLAEVNCIKQDYAKYIKNTQPDGAQPCFFDDHVQEYFKEKHDLNQDETLAVCEIFDENKSFQLSEREFTKLRKYLEDDIGKKVCLYQVQMLKLIHAKLDSILHEGDEVIERRKSSFHQYQEKLKKLASVRKGSIQIKSESVRV